MPATAGHGAQVGGVAHHFRKRHEGIDGGFAMLGVHTLHAGTPGVEVAHDVAHVGFGNSDGDAHDRFVEDWISFFESNLEGFATGNFKSDWFGVDRVFLSINNGTLTLCTG